MSYVLFSQTSTADGQRNNWLGSASGESSGSNAAVVNGVVTTVANSTFSESALVSGWGTDNFVGANGEVSGYADGVLVRTSQRALFNLGDADGSLGGYQLNSTLAADLAGLGNVLNVGAAATLDTGTNAQVANNRTLDSVSGFVDGILNLGLSDLNWNDIKNVEVFLASAETGDTGIAGLELRSFVDARVKIGDESGCRDAADFNTVETRGIEFGVKILDGKRGQIEGSQSDLAINATIDVWTNGGSWQNSFSNTGSAFGDTFDINFGKLAVVSGISEFGLGSGFLVDADGNFSNLQSDTDQFSAYNGDLTTLFTNAGGGNDTYDATTGIRLVSAGVTDEAELRTIDYVWGGSGNDTIKGGGGNDFLFGDFGAVGSTGIMQMADPTVTKLRIGGTEDVSRWVTDTGVTIWGRPLAANDESLSNTVFKVSGADLTQRAYFEVPVADSAQNAATWTTASGGIGISLTPNGRAPNGTEANPEVNADANDDGGVSDVLAVGLGRNASGADFTLSLFYAVDGGSKDIETALITAGNDTDGDGDIDEVVGSFVLRADGSVASVSGLTASGAAAVPGGQAYSASNPGLVSGSFSTTATFNMIEFRSAGLVDKVGSAYTPTANGDVSDFYLREICFTLPQPEGNDIIEAGSGADLLNGGGDNATVLAEIVVNFEGTTALLNNGYGIYNVATSEVIDSRVRPISGAVNYSQAIDLADVPNVGFFIVVGGALLNQSGPPTELPNGTDVASIGIGQVTFADAAGTTRTAFFSDDAQNPGGTRMVINDRDNAVDLDTDGSTVNVAQRYEVAGNNVIGRIGFEDSRVDDPSTEFNEADFDYNDIVLNTSLRVTVTGGDRLDLGGDDNARDTVVFSAGDGFDIVTGWDADGLVSQRDVLDLDNGEASVLNQWAANVNGQNGVLLAIVGGGHIFVEGVSYSDLIFV